MSVRFSAEELARLKDLLLIYEWGQRTLLTRLNIIHEDQKNFQSNNSIEYIKNRIKSPGSIASKLQKMNLEITADNARKHVTDIVGIRIICQFAKDIYSTANMLKSMADVTVLNEKDYVGNPKPSGYRSYHVTIEMPVCCSERIEILPIEIQIRTAAMDFWATLEHQVKYKYQGHVPQHLSDELIVCADKIIELDNRMFLIHDIISLINQDS